VRAVFIIDPKNIVRLILYYPMNVGRNIDEIIRAIQALQTADANNVACPANWKPGEKVIVPPPKTQKELDERLAGKFDEVVDFYLVKKSL
jgi:peroxiredoxin (alkyl hydroperoxide reductase subunit C)